MKCLEPRCIDEKSGSKKEHKPKKVSKKKKQIEKGCTTSLLWKKITMCYKYCSEIQKM